MRIGRKHQPAVDRRRLTVNTGPARGAEEVRFLPSTVNGRRSRPLGEGGSEFGFTLLELMVVMTLILILAALVATPYHIAVVRAREAVLRDDLYTMRKLIDEYTLDKQQPPASLDDLVEAGYLRGGLPLDPFTGSNQTWRADSEDVPIGPGQNVPGIVDVHSGSEDSSLEGTPYSSW